eukprot:TRINITY_DN2189_c0_g1_i18.p2 TRINITY_DN2189_c0_g1~~TRINITY_DN2189_c0_g1_i18.p2  ORF type:complete len:138 (-),score=8.57 TRINITY_DN2189_c0_g1_i18:263-676(-)
MVTRWYRVPELIRLEREYSAAIEVWSLDCIFTELLGRIIQPSGQNTIVPRRFKKGHGCPVGQRDQLNVNLSVLGTPDESDFDFVTVQVLQEQTSKICTLRESGYQLREQDTHFSNPNKRITSPFSKVQRQNQGDCRT